MYPHPTSWKSILLLSASLCLSLPSGLLHSSFPTKSLYPLSTPIPATCPAYHILLDFITRTILGEEYKSFSSSLCNLLHSPVTSSLQTHILTTCNAYCDSSTQLLHECASMSRYACFVPYTWPCGVKYKDIHFSPWFVCFSSHYTFIFCAVPYINEMDVYIHPDYVNGTYDSCHQVVMPSSGGLALGSMCLPYGAENCNPERWANQVRRKGIRVVKALSWCCSCYGMSNHVDYLRIVLIYPEDDGKTSSKLTANENPQTHVSTKIKHNYSLSLLDRASSL